ncbi:PilZ domain-containing protein [Aurantiacibacter marinus]|uniref:PilZ domain-containing protein n=1 Tax=Aurantiacibacter marinus TaxID=874156 RepID=A0A0H0XW77_9SPHN|nr:PilZ domain-containing protein [Aurantiacibacter marinus]KLI64550.1 hypothetical protein AAV99_02965 [Aurantiacibacter marinus]
MQTRQEPRKALTVPGRYVAGDGDPVDVHLCDLSVGGARFASSDSALMRGSQVYILIAGRGPYRASVKWCADGECGVTFTVPLSPETFEQFQNSHIADFSDEGTEADFPPMPPQTRQRFC